MLPVRRILDVSVMDLDKLSLHLGDISTFSLISIKGTRGAK